MKLGRTRYLFNDRNVLFIAIEAVSQFVKGAMPSQAVRRCQHAINPKRMRLYQFFYSIAINIYRNPMPKIPFKTFQELQQLAKDKKISVIASSGSGAAIVNSTFPEHSIVYVRNSIEAMERVNADSDAVHFGSESAILGAMHLFNCNLIVVADASFPQQYGGILFSKSAPNRIRNMPIATIMAFRTMFKKYDKKYHPRLMHLDCDANLVKALKIVQIESAFYLIAIGYFTAGIQFAIELVVFTIKRKTNVQNKNARNLKPE